MSNAPRNETQVQYHRRRMTELKSVRSVWEGLWRDLADHFDPTRLRLGNLDEKALSRAKILDSTGTVALRTLASGMHSGLTSPARSWFKLKASDADLAENASIKEYLAHVEKRMREIFQGSNIYKAFHTGYWDLGMFGQMGALLVEDEKDTIRIVPLLNGTFWIARDEKGRATTMYRTFRWTVQKIVERFGIENCSETIKGQFERGQYDEQHTICHAIEPRIRRDKSSIHKKNKPFLSNYWEDERARDDRMLEISGFDENPILSAAWELAGDDSYGSAPGHVALSHVKMLQKEQLRKLEAIDKKVRPPMTGPTSMMNNPASLLPGEITYVDSQTGGAGFRPAMEVNLQISELAQDIAEQRDMIREIMFADLFLMLSNMQGIQPRGEFELAERKEEKLLALGPVLENIYHGWLEPVIERTYAIMERNGLLPPAPLELQGKDFKIEYTSMLAQAQKAIATGAIERGLSFVGNLAASAPEIMDKIDLDAVVDEYWDALGASPALLRSNEAVEKLRADRAEQIAAAQQAEQMAQMAPAARQGAEAARLLSEIDQGGSGASAMAQMLGGGI